VRLDHHGKVVVAIAVVVLALLVLPMVL